MMLKSNFGYCKKLVPTRKPTRMFGLKFGMQGLTWIVAQEHWRSHFIRVLSFLVRPFDGSREAVAVASICLRYVPRPGGRLCRTDGLKRTSEVLHREGRQGVLAPEVPHLLQQTWLASIQILRTAGNFLFSSSHLMQIS